MVLTKEKRNRLVLSLLPQIKRMAAEIYRHLPEGSVDFDELVNEAVLAVLEASKRLRRESFNGDGSLTPQARSFLLIRAKGAMFDYLRSLDFGSKKLRESERKLEEARNKLRQKLGREPTERELASLLGVEEGEILKLEEKISFSYLLSLEEVFAKTTQGNFENFLSDGGDVEREVERRELVKRLKEALGKLDGRELLVLQLLFFEGLKASHVAQILDISPGRITQIKKKALKKLAEEMERYL